jgi:3-hydroxyisobutyrate dehydrogenase
VENAYNRRLDWAVDLQLVWVAGSGVTRPERTATGAAVGTVAKVASMTATVGMIGAGRIGLPVCSQLVRAGYEVVVHDHDPARERPVRDVGAQWAPGVDAVTACGVVITVLPGSAELRDAMDVALAAMHPKSTWIDLTSSSPLVVGQLWPRADARCIETLDAPVGGGIAAARAGTLQLFVGGASKTVGRHRALLEALGVVHHVGGRGAGYTTKLIVNLLWFVQALATGEAFMLALRAGLDPEVLRDAVQASPASNEFTDRHLDALLDGDYLRDFGLERCCEELDAVAELAGDLDAPAEVAALAARAYRRALNRYGPQDGELLAIALLEEESGMLLRRDRDRAPQSGQLDPQPSDMRP